MPETYDPNKAIEDQAADAALRAIALYKAAGWRREQFENLPLNFWGSTPAAVPQKEGQ